MRNVKALVFRDWGNAVWGQSFSSVFSVWRLGRIAGRNPSQNEKNQQKDGNLQGTEAPEAVLQSF